MKTVTLFKYVLISLLLWISQGSATVIQVNSQVGPIYSIVAAINSAAPGDSIELTDGGAGAYYEDWATITGPTDISIFTQSVNPDDFPVLTISNWSNWWLRAGITRFSGVALSSCETITLSDINDRQVIFDRVIIRDYSDFAFVSLPGSQGAGRLTVYNTIFKSNNSDLFTPPVTTTTTGPYATIWNSTFIDNNGLLYSTTLTAAQVADKQYIEVFNSLFNNYFSLLGLDPQLTFNWKNNIIPTMVNILSWDPSNFYGDDLGFISASPMTNNDYALSESSVARDAGMNLGAPTWDMRKNIRPIGSNVDIGAFEYQDATPPAYFSFWPFEENISNNPVLQISFTEQVKRGTGNFDIYMGTTLFQSIPIHDPHILVGSELLEGFENSAWGSWTTSNSVPLQISSYPKSWEASRSAEWVVNSPTAIASYTYGNPARWSTWDSLTVWVYSDCSLAEARVSITGGTPATSTAGSWTSLPAGTWTPVTLALNSQMAEINRVEKMNLEIQGSDACTILMDGWILSKKNPYSTQVKVLLPKPLQPYGDYHIQAPQGIFVDQVGLSIAELQASNSWFFYTNSNASAGEAYHWDINNSVGFQDGDGIWSKAFASNWSWNSGTGSVLTEWPGPGNYAIFGGGALLGTYQVTIEDTVSVDSMLFLSGLAQYNIGGQALHLSGNAAIHTQFPVHMSVALLGQHGLRKWGPDTLFLDGLNTDLKGPVDIREGVIQLSSTQNLPTITQLQLGGEGVPAGLLIRETMTWNMPISLKSDGFIASHFNSTTQSLNVTSDIRLTFATGAVGYIKNHLFGSILLNGKILAESENVIALLGQGIKLGGQNQFKKLQLLESSSVDIMSQSAIPDTAIIGIDQFANLDLNGFNDTLYALTGSNGTITNKVLSPTTLTLSPDTGTWIYGGQIYERVALIKRGAGRQVLQSMQNLVTESIHVQQGSLQITSGLNTSSSSMSITIDSGATLEFGGHILATLEASSHAQLHALSQPSSAKKIILETSSVIAVRALEGDLTYFQSDSQFIATGCLDIQDPQNMLVAGRFPILISTNGIIDSGLTLCAKPAGFLYELSYAPDTLYVQVTENQGPTGISLSNLNIAEDASIGGLIATLTASDPNTNDSHVFSLRQEVGCDENLGILNSELMVSQPLDFETKDTIQLCLRVTDLNGSFFDQDFKIAILDVNEAPTLVNLSNTIIAENLTAGTLIGTLSSIDPEGLSITYTLIQEGTDYTAFEISGNELKTLQTFDYEVQNIYRISIQASDGLLSQVTNLDIYISDIPENNPISSSSMQSSSSSINTTNSSAVSSSSSNPLLSSSSVLWTANPTVTIAGQAIRIDINLTGSIPRGSSWKASITKPGYTQSVAIQSPLYPILPGSWSAEVWLKADNGDTLNRWVLPFVIDTPAISISANNWQMVSFGTKSNQWAEIPSTDLIFHWLGGEYISKEYLPLPNPDQGYWILAQDSGYLTQLPLQTTVSSRSTTLNSTDMSWNMVANPFTWPILADSNFIFFEWNPASNGYQTQSVLMPGLGYWVQTRQLISLRWNPKPIFTNPTLLNKVQFAHANTLEDWTLQIQLQSGSIQDNQNIIGSSPTASPSLGPEDWGKAPQPLAKHVRVQLGDYSEPLSKDIRPPQNGIWEFPVKLSASESRYSQLSVNGLRELNGLGLQAYWIHNSQAHQLRPSEPLTLQIPQQGILGRIRIQAQSQTHPIQNAFTLLRTRSTAQGWIASFEAPLSLQGNIAEMQLVDSRGATYWKQSIRITSNSQQIEIPKQKNGLYYLQIRCGKVQAQVALIQSNL